MHIEITDEIIAKIAKKSLNAVNKTHNAMYDMIAQYRCAAVTLEDHLESRLGKLERRVLEIESTLEQWRKQNLLSIIQGHMHGVQAVYDEMQEFKKQFSRANLEELTTKLDNLNLDDKIKDAEARLSNTQAAEALKKFEELREMVSDMHAKLSY